jgi:conjugative relaxase-like TrwC/TraI family protein
MLRMVESKSADAAKSYYAEGLAREDYYSEGQEVVGEWGGRGAAMLGLRGRVDREGFAALCENRLPDGRGPLTARTDARRRVGYDLNFHAPKSLSLLYAFSGDGRILGAFRQAVGDTMREMEAEMKTRVRRAGAQSDRVTGNLTWAEFIHFTARPVGGLPDPHLHAHCFTFNATFDTMEGRWKAGEFGDLKRDAPYFEAAFHARLARAVRDLGYGTERTARGWEIGGIPPELRAKFSRRTAQIEAVAEARGLAGEAKARLGALTRGRKDHGTSWATLRERWAGRLSPEEAAAIAKACQPASGGDGQAITPEAAIRHAERHVMERASAVPEKTLLREALRHGAGDVEVEGVRQAAGGLLRATIAGQRFVTSPSVLAEEKAMLAWAKKSRGTQRSLGGGKVGRARDARLSNEQRAAVRHLLSSRDRVIALRGGAGTGKTTLMQEAVAQIRDGGHAVFAFAPTAEASRGVLRDEGFAEADTVARLLRDQQMQERIRGQVIWIDEAGLLGSKTMGEVFRVAEAQGARVILMGDVRQHGAVERGDALRLLETRAGIRPAELTEIRRQRGAYREAVAALAGGAHERAFAKLEAGGAVREVADPRERYAALARDYAAAREAGKSALIIAPTHAEGDRVTEAVRGELRERGQLGKSERQVSRLVGLQWTEAQRRDPRHYEPGQVVVFTQNAPGYRKGERLQVVGRNDAGDVAARTSGGERRTVPLAAAGAFQVYREESLPIAAGDRVRALQNGRTADGRHRINNGAVYEVAGFNREGNIRLANGWTVGRDFGHLAHGYAVTSHASQGKTVDRVFIAQSAASLPATSREQFYVSVSRGREAARIYTDDKAALRDAVGRSDRRISATELHEHASRQKPPGWRAFTLHRFRQRVRELTGRRAASLNNQTRERDRSHEPERDS